MSNYSRGRNTNNRSTTIPKVIIDSHVHVMTSRSTPINLLWGIVLNKLFTSSDSSKWSKTKHITIRDLFFIIRTIKDCRVLIEKVKQAEKIEVAIDFVINIFSYSFKENNLFLGINIDNFPSIKNEFIKEFKYLNRFRQKLKNNALVRFGKFISLGSKSTLQIADELLKEVQHFLKNNNYRHFNSYKNTNVLNIALPMNLDFAHYWGNWWLPICLQNNNRKGFWVIDDYCRIYKLIKFEVITGTETENDVTDYRPYTLTYDIDLSKAKSTYRIKILSSNNQEFSHKELQLMDKKYKHFIREVEDKNYCIHNRQIVDTMKVALMHPLQIMPFYHFDPRAHFGKQNQIYTRVNDLLKNHIFFEYSTNNFEKKHRTFSVELKEKKFKPKELFSIIKSKMQSFKFIFRNNVNNMNGKALFWGFKMYTRLGYAPDDFARFPGLNHFYSNCATLGIPIINHTNSGGMGIEDHYIYFKEAANNHNMDHKQRKYKNFLFWQKKDAGAKIRWPWYNTDNDLNCIREWKSSDFIIKQSNLEKHIFDNYVINGMRYIDETCVRPLNWANVLERYPRLKLCFAHFGGSDKWDKYGAYLSPSKKDDYRSEIVHLVEKYINVYTDISYFSDLTKKVKKTFINLLKSHSNLKDRILLGSDWYMVKVDRYDLNSHNNKIYSFLKEISEDVGYDTYYQFSVINPLRFLGLLNLHNMINKERLKNHKNYVLQMLKNSYWKEQINNDSKIDNARKKVNEIYNILINLKVNKQ